MLYYNIMIKNIDSIVTSTFLLILAMAGGYISQTLGCKTQKLLTNNMFSKHLVLLMLIYFTNSSFIMEDESPKEILKLTLMIYVGYLLYTKMDIYFTLFVFILLFLYYILHSFKNYYKEDPEKQEHVQKIILLQKSIINYIVISIIIGFLLYAREKKIEYGKKFSIYKFIMGVPTCKGLK